MEFLHTMVRISDIESSIDFYCKKLGLIEFSRKDHEKGRFTLIFLCAPDDKKLADDHKKPLLELTYNWDKEKYYNEEVIKDKIKNKEDLFERGHKFEYVLIDDSYPDYLRKNQEKYSKWILDE